MGALHKGTHEGCPYETCKLFAKKTRIYGIAMQGPPSGPAALPTLRVLAEPPKPHPDGKAAPMNRGATIGYD